MLQILGSLQMSPAMYHFQGVPDCPNFTPTERPMLVQAFRLPPFASAGRPEYWRFKGAVRKPRLDVPRMLQSG